MSAYNKMINNIPSGVCLKYSSNKLLRLQTNEQKRLLYKKIQLNKSNNLQIQTLNHILSLIVDYSKQQQRKDSSLNLVTFQIITSEFEDKICFELIRPYFKIQTLRQILIHPLQKETKELLLKGLLNAFIQTINLNHIICTLDNIFIEKKWNKTIDIGFNYTSFGHYFSLVNQKLLHRQEFKEIYNYLKEQSSYLPNQYGFDFQIKLKSFSLSILSVALENQVDLLKYQNIPQYLNAQNIKQYLSKQSQFFQIMLNIPEIQQKIKKIEDKNQVRLMQFFKKTLVRNENIKSVFTKWSQVIEFLDSKVLEPYEYIFALQKRVYKKNKMDKDVSYLQEYIRKLWLQEADYTKKRFLKMGIIDDNPCRKDLLLYILYKYNLNNSYLQFQIQEKIFLDRQFLKQTFQLYNQIIKEISQDTSQHKKIKIIYKIMSQLQIILKTCHFYQNNNKNIILNMDNPIIEAYIEQQSIL